MDAGNETTTTCTRIPPLSPACLPPRQLIIQNCKCAIYLDNDALCCAIIYGRNSFFFSFIFSLSLSLFSVLRDFTSAAATASNGCFVSFRRRVKTLVAETLRRNKSLAKHDAITTFVLLLLLLMLFTLRLPYLHLSTFFFDFSHVSHFSFIFMFFLFFYYFFSGRHRLERLALRFF